MFMTQGALQRCGKSPFQRPIWAAWGKGNWVNPHPTSTFHPLIDLWEDVDVEEYQGDLPAPVNGCFRLAGQVRPSTYDYGDSVHNFLSKTYISGPRTEVPTGTLTQLFCAFFLWIPLPRRDGMGRENVQHLTGT